MCLRERIQAQVRDRLLLLSVIGTLEQARTRLPPLAVSNPAVNDWEVSDQEVHDQKVNYPEANNSAVNDQEAKYLELKDLRVHAGMVLLLENDVHTSVAR